MELQDGSTVAVVGGGPAGSFTAYFIKKMSGLLGIDIHVDVYEPKDFSAAGAKGCNHCGGVVSESLIQFLATEGINIPAAAIMNTIDSYALHTDSGHVILHTPSQEMRIATIFRGGGPKGIGKTTDVPIESFDGYLLELACSQGARHIQDRVSQLSWNDGRPQVTTKGKATTTYDLLVGAVGVNGTGSNLFQSLGFGYQPPKVSKTFVNDFYLGTELVQRWVGNTMHVFLLDIPGVNQGAIIPKGPFVTVCFVAEEVTSDLIDRFYNHPEVRNCLPPNWQKPSHRETCLCMPDTNVGDPSQFYADRVVLVGDCGVARLFKDGIGSAYRTAKACATTAVLWGVAREDFQKHYLPVCNQISRDNHLGHAVLSGFGLARRLKTVRYSILSTAAEEQSINGEDRIMSMTLWNSFSGSSPYIDIFTKALSRPGFLARYLWAIGKGLSGAEYKSPPVV